MSNPTLNSFLDTFAAPNLVFDRIREKSISPWLPFLTVIIVSTLVYGWYFMTVDMYQFMETSMILSGQEAGTAELEAVMQGEAIIRGVSTATAAIGMAIVYLLVALYFFLAATLIAEEKYSFGQFFSIIAWGSLPGLLSVLSTALTYSMATEYVYVAFLDKTTLASLMGMGLDHTNFDMASSLSVSVIWSYVLYGLGFARITRCSATTAVVVGLIPPAIQFGLTYFL